MEDWITEALATRRTSWAASRSEWLLVMASTEGLIA
ncbi:hypothetical protein ACVWXB_000152 [Streptomyces sp. TE12347]